MSLRLGARRVVAPGCSTILLCDCCTQLSPQSHRRQPGAQLRGHPQPAGGGGTRPGLGWRTICMAGGQRGPYMRAHTGRQPPNAPGWCSVLPKGSTGGEDLGLWAGVAGAEAAGSAGPVGGPSAGVGTVMDGGVGSLRCSAVPHAFHAPMASKQGGWSALERVRPKTGDYHPGKGWETCKCNRCWLCGALQVQGASIVAFRWQPNVLSE